MSKGRIVDHKLSMKIREYDKYVKPLTYPGVSNYNLLRILKRVYDDDNVVVEGTYLVEQKDYEKLQYTMNIIELTTEASVMNTLREIAILKQIGINKHIMGLYCEFRHRQYIAMMFPPFIPVRGHLDAKLKQLNKISTDEQPPYLFSSKAVAHVVKRVVKGLDYLHSQGFIHTELCADNVFINVVSNVKIGGFVHAKLIGTKSRKFNGDPNCLPPECIIQDDSLSITPAIDAWSLGLLTLEIITGKRHYLKDQKVKRLASEYLEGVRKPPSLGDVEPRTAVNGVQEYSSSIDSFLLGLLNVDPSARSSMKNVLRHPFLKKKTDKELIQEEWKVGVDSFLEDKNIRSLFTEMMLCRGSSSDINDELLKNIIIALDYVAEGKYQLFKSIEETDIYNNYIGVEASIAIPYDDSNWSRDVLDISQNIYEPKDLKPDLPYPQHQHLNEDGHPGLKKDYQRFEIVYFINKQWSKHERQTFTAIQFGRWHEKGVIQFTDLIRVVDEIEEVIKDYVINKIRLEENNEYPESVYFASPQRAIRIDKRINDDPKARFLEHIYVDVSLSPSTNKKKLGKLRELMADEPLEFPENVTPLQVSVAYEDIDPSQFEALEKQMLSEMQVDNWDFEELQRTADARIPETRLYRLLFERRRNYNKAFTPDTNGQFSNQARTQKIWGDYTRDFLYKVCKWAVPYKMEQEDVQRLYGQPFQTEEEKDKAIRNATTTATDELMSLENQLWRTQLKQEQDAREIFKRHEDTDLRRSALMKYESNKDSDYTLKSQLKHEREFNDLATPKQPARRRWSKPKRLEKR